MRYCAQPNCPTLVVKGRCATHARTHEKAARGNANQRGYTYQWAKYSQARLTRLPVCGMREDCSLDTTHSQCAREGMTILAQCTDHIVPLSQGGAMWDVNNHLSLCLACNTWKAQTIERQALAAQRGEAYGGIKSHANPYPNHSGASRKLSGIV